MLSGKHSPSRRCSGRLNPTIQLQQVHRAAGAGRIPPVRHVHSGRPELTDGSIPSGLAVGELVHGQPEVLYVRLCIVQQDS